ncbi:uncharacterized protein C630.12 isoform X2 [Tripterygium wilfordii]|uniref:uncharacterized protein C630.12 isoform X2 n=1 Tax=Tripterygium wilfordii TaxID=458696 RepID=UPI0018F82898|nr:uncharacterized protein C630.12 isoform X2 [Tripterygium wilfordii]
MKAQDRRLTVVLTIVWSITILYGEMFAYWVPLCSCSWPSPPVNSTLMGGEGRVNHYSKLAVLTDPQLMDKTSLGVAPKSLALETAQFYTDLYMRRAFFASILPFKPDVILFLGDYFDGGPYLLEEEWQESLSRFKHIFGLNMLERHKDTPVYYLSGNHDIGYAGLNSRNPKVISRYEKEFGPRNFRFIAGEVEFIVVDAQTVDGQGDSASATWDFAKNVSNVQLRPRVLLTHIPLHRRDWTSCGPNRSSPVINQRITRAAQSQEIVYQNYITEESSNRLLELIKPVLILSGHDHDQCTVIHELKSGIIKEQTVGTLSWQMGNLYPSFMLLSVSNSALGNTSTPEEAVITQLCFLPMQMHIYIWYLLLFVLTLLAILFNGMGFWDRFTDMIRSSRELVSHNIFRGGTKEKDDDDDGEYEMIWDAEGSMHLVKKKVNAPVKHPVDKGFVERGNAVVRPTAKKNVSQEVEVCMNIDEVADMGVVPAFKLPHRTTKSRTKIIIYRLIRAFQMLAVIAAVNVPIYMMLLFKDWIDQ